jgi:CMP/dCMP kinase
MVIAIDGPAGTGKSTVARAVAERLGFTYLDTGAMYRTVALNVLETGGSPAEIARALDLKVGDPAAIRTPEVTAKTSHIAADPQVREALIARQRDMLRTGDWVAEGRDIGTVVAPDAAVKVFLTARPDERARRRAEQTGGDYAQILRDQAERDERDSSANRSIREAPEGAVEIDTTEMTLEDVIERVAALVERTRA